MLYNVAILLHSEANDSLRCVKLFIYVHVELLVALRGLVGVREQEHLHNDADIPDDKDDVARDVGYWEFLKKK